MTAPKTTRTTSRIALWLAGAAGTVVLAIWGLNTVGAQRWSQASQALLDQLEAARTKVPRAPYDARELRGLPLPVQKYFRAVLTDGQPMVTKARVRHTGTFNVTAFESRAMWFAFTSQQSVVTHRPGFVWDACIALLPGIAIHIHDAYVAGVGTLHPAVWGLFSLANQHGRGEIACGELMRYMMEATWYPTALLPSQGTTWVAVDEATADATMVDGEIRMTMRYTFDRTTGLVSTVAVAARGALVDGRVVMLPWEGRMSNYQSRGGMQVPLTGEAAWLTDDGRKPYWRGTIAEVGYDFG
jgi:hypothetical protein